MSRSGPDFDWEKALGSLDFSRGHREAVRNRIFARMGAGDDRELTLSDLDEVAAGFADPLGPDDFPFDE